MAEINAEGHIHAAEGEHVFLFVKGKVMVITWSITQKTWLILTDQPIREI